MPDDEDPPTPPPPVDPDAAELRVEQQDDVVVLRVAGEVDVSQQHALTVALGEALRLARRDVVVDLGRCTFIDHGTIHLVDVAAGSLRARGGQLVVVDPPRSFTLVEGIGAAVRAFVVDGGTAGEGDDPAGAWPRRRRRATHLHLVPDPPHEGGRPIGRPSKYSAELRRRAVHEVLDRGRRIADVAAELRVASPQTVRYWVKEEARRRGATGSSCG